MINLATVQPFAVEIKAMTERNNHIGALRAIACLVLEDSDLLGSLDLLAKLAKREGITAELKPLRDLLYRTTMDAARRSMTPDAFHAIYMST